MSPPSLLVPPAIFFAARPHVQVEIFAFLFVPPHELVYPIGSDTWVVVSVRARLYLFGYEQGFWTTDCGRHKAFPPANSPPQS